MPITSDPLSTFFASIFTIGNDDGKKNISFQYRCSFMQLDDSYKIYLRRKYTHIFDYVEGAIGSSGSTLSSKTSSSVERIGWIIITKRPGELVESAKHMLVSEFCERLHFYGIRVMLVTYLHQQIHYSEKMSILIYHSFLMFVYLSCVFSKAVFMSYFNMKKCLITSCVACILGDLLLILSANWRSGGLTLCGLLVVGISIGCSKPITMLIGPEQFTKDERIDMVYFLKIFHDTVSAAGIIASFCYPLLRSYLACPDGISCYMQIYFVGQFALLISLVSLLMARKNWKNDKVQREQPVITVMLCAHNAYLILQKEQLLSNEPLEDFLDYSAELYEEEFIAEIKIFRKLLYLYMSLPIFWSLCYQQCSSWVLQAVKMDGDFGIFIIRPEHMQLCCILIGMFISDKLYIHVKRLLTSMWITHRLQRVTLAIALAAIAFLVAAYLEYNLDRPSHKPVLKHVMELSKTQAELRIYNVMPCRYKFDLGESGSIFKLRNLHVWSHIFYNFETPFFYTLTAVSLDVHCPKIRSEILIEPGRMTSYFLAYDKLLEFKDFNQASDRNNTSAICLLFNGKMEESNHLRLRNVMNEKIIASRAAYESHYNGGNLMINVPFSTYYFEIDGVRISKNFEAHPGISYTILIEGSKKKGFYSAIYGWVSADANDDSETRDNDDMLIIYQIPQIIIIKLAECIFLNEGITFALDHIPSSLSSVVHFLWILNVGTGQFLVICLMIVFNFKSFVYWYLSFATIMFINMLVFAYFALKYNAFFRAAKEAKSMRNMSAKKLRDLKKKKNDEKT